MCDGDPALLSEPLLVLPAGGMDWVGSPGEDGAPSNHN